MQRHFLKLPTRNKNSVLFGGCEMTFVVSMYFCSDTDVKCIGCLERVRKERMFWALSTLKILLQNYKSTCCFVWLWNFISFRLHFIDISFCIFFPMYCPLVSQIFLLPYQPDSWLLFILFCYKTFKTQSLFCDHILNFFVFLTAMHTHILVSPMTNP